MVKFAESVEQNLDRRFEAFYTAKVYTTYEFKKVKHTCDIFVNVIMEDGELKINPTSALKEKGVRKWDAETTGQR